MADTSQALPPYALLVRHPVADWDAWKQGFDDHEEVRRDAGFLAHRINRAEGDPNDLSIYMGVGDLDGARAFIASDELKEIMEQVGVTGPPDIRWMEPKSFDVVWEGEYPAMIVSHTVADFGEWLSAYDDADDLRSDNGIIGHAANRSLDDPSTVSVYHQAESFETLRSFLANPDLQVAMKEAGATSEPDASFYLGGWAKRYD